MKHIELNNQVTQTAEDGFFDLGKDQEAVQQFMVEAEEKTVKFATVEEKIKYMVDNDYYYPELVKEYSIDEIEAIYDITHSAWNQFQSYMAISKFYKDYALKTNDKKQYLESYPDRVAIVSLYLGRGDFESAARKAQQIIKQNFQPATPTFLNAGRSRRGEMVSCFLLEMDDSLNSIGFNVNTSMQLSKIGGGVALNLSKLRARGEVIKMVENAASGVMPVMKLLEDSFSYANQLGQRKGAGAAYLNIFHWDVNEFLDSKKINADEKSRIQSLSIGLIVPNKFFDLAKNDEPLHVFAPYTVWKEYGEHLDDMDLDQMYDELVQNPNVKKRQTMSARDMLTKIAVTQLESGYPYLMFKSNANAHHPLKRIGDVKMSNLCTEIFQVQETSIINNYDQEDEIKRDINCNLGSLNIVNVMENNELREATHVGIESLTAVANMTAVENAPTVKKANDELHSVGLGAMNLHGFLAKNLIDYESKEARDFARTFFMMMNFYSLEKSMLIAKEREETFKDFNKSSYADGSYFNKYILNDYSPVTDKVKELFANMDIPGPAEWAALKEDVMRYGIFNAYRMAIAPTQSISYVQNSTSSVMPIVSQIESRTYANSTTYYPMPYMSKENFWYYKSAYDMDQFKIIDMVAEIQEHVDQGISTILFVNSDVSTRQLSRYYVYAAQVGLKSLYYTRTRKLSVDECISCSV